jgi:hypothetical protein
MPRLLPLLCLAALLASAPCLHARQAEGAPPQQRVLSLDELPPTVRLGARAETVRRAWPVLPIVVIVNDEISYLEALAQWSAEKRYPVLIDDGSAEVREDIARFVRAFEPRAVVRWSADAGNNAPVRWPADAAERMALIETTIHRVWSRALPGEREVPPVDSMLRLISRWQGIGVTPPGIVVADVTDDAWPAAVALSIGRLQPLAWVTTSGTLGGTMSAADFNRLAAEVEEAVEATGLSWRDIGDDIDAITICLNIPAKVQPDGPDVLATTDMLGRHRTPAEAEGVPPRRWAWAGQIPGSQARAAYAAMCSLFLGQSRAWLFDGYPDDHPWSLFDATAAAEHLRNAGMELILDDAPRQDLAQWRRRAADGINAGFIAVNTKGMGNEFHLHRGQARPGDIPHLYIPSFVYKVHSFSASSLGARETVAARWLERGVYAYCGSVHEPFLNGFVPTPVVTARLAATVPWGAAVRYDDGPPWKIAIIGDPLLALGPPALRVEEDAALPLDDAADIGHDLRLAIEAQRFEDGIRGLVLLGRDQHITRLASALLAERASEITPKAADAALMSAYRMGEVELFIALYARLSPDDASAGWRRDALWQIVHPGLAATRSRELVDLLARHLRVDQIGRDASELAGPMVRLAGAPEAMTMLESAHDSATSSSERELINKAMERIRSRIGRIPR